jgi:hypothetical protein
VVGVERVTHVGMESTGVYWVPVYAVLEGHFQLIVGNARHIRNVPGRKSDVKDAEWIAELICYGLIRPSFVPAKPLRAHVQQTDHRIRAGWRIPVNAIAAEGDGRRPALTGIQPSIIEIEIWCGARHRYETRARGLLPSTVFIFVAMAQTKPANSHAMAALTMVFCFPARISLRCRRHSRSSAFQAMSRISLGRRSCCRRCCRLRRAGKR